jgi:hypothetical protein
VPFSEQRARHRHDAAGEHGCAPHFGGGYCPGRRDCFDHDALQRSLSQFAHHQAHEEILLLRRRFRENAFQHLDASGGGSLPPGRGEDAKRRIHILQ